MYRQSNFNNNVYLLGLIKVYNALINEIDKVTNHLVFFKKITIIFKPDSSRQLFWLNRILGGGYMETVITYLAKIFQLAIFQVSIENLIIFPLHSNCFIE